MCKALKVLISLGGGGGERVVCEREREREFDHRSKPFILKILLNMCKAIKKY